MTENAFPNFFFHNPGFDFEGGLTKRELFAAMAMQGMAAQPNPLNDDEAAELSVLWADALIAELAKPTEGI